MNPLQALMADLKAAMKEKREGDIQTARLLIAAIKNLEIQKRTDGRIGELTEEEIIQLLRTEAKKRKDSITVFSANNREDLAAKERTELAYVEKYLPQLLNREATEELVAKIIHQSKPVDFGSAMKEVMNQLKGKVDNALVAQIIKRLLQK